MIINCSKCGKVFNNPGMENTNTFCPECKKKPDRCEGCKDVEVLAEASLVYVKLCKTIIDMALQKESAFDFSTRRTLKVIKGEIEKALKEAGIQ